MKISVRTITAAVLGTALLSTAACSSSGSDSKGSSSVKPIANLTSLPGGKTTSVKLDAGFVKALGALKLTPGVVGTATLTKDGSVHFPITGGHVTIYPKGKISPYVVGEVDHDGSGLSLTAGSTKVTLENFVVNPGKHANIKGKVTLNGKVAAPSAVLFYLNGSTLKPITIDKSTGVATLTGTQVTLSNQAAALLDMVFKTTAVKGGLPIGIATLLVNSK